MGLWSAVGRLKGGLGLLKPTRGMAARAASGALAGGMFGGFSSMMNEDASFSGSIAKGAVIGAGIGGLGGNVFRRSRTSSILKQRNVQRGHLPIRGPFLPYSHPNAPIPRLFPSSTGPSSLGPTKIPGIFSPSKYRHRNARGQFVSSTKMLSQVASTI